MVAYPAHLQAYENRDGGLFVTEKEDVRRYGQEAGHVLGIIKYWHQLSKNGKSRMGVKRHGYYWIARTAKDMIEESGLSLWKIRRVYAQLRKERVIETKVMRFRKFPTVHIRLLPPPQISGKSRLSLVPKRHPPPKTTKNPSDSTVLRPTANHPFCGNPPKHIQKSTLQENTFPPNPRKTGDQDFSRSEKIRKAETMSEVKATDTTTTERPSAPIEATARGLAETLQEPSYSQPPLSSPSSVKDGREIPPRGDQVGTENLRPAATNGGGGSSAAPAGGYQNGVWVDSLGNTESIKKHLADLLGQDYKPDASGSAAAGTKDGQPDASQNSCKDKAKSESVLLSGDENKTVDGTKTATSVKETLLNMGKRGSRANGTNPRAMGTNPRAKAINRVSENISENRGVEYGEKYTKATANTYEQRLVKAKAEHKKRYGWRENAGMSPVKFREEDYQDILHPRQESKSKYWRDN